MVYVGITTKTASTLCENSLFLTIVARKYYSLRCFASSKAKTVSKLSALKDGVAGFSSRPVKM